MKEATVEAGGAVSMHELSDEPSRDANIILPTYRLHVENPESDFFDVGLAAPLILNGSLLEQKHNCLGKDLQTLSFLNLNHEGLSSLGEVILSYWCPSARIFTADMNRLSSVSNAFIGYEETLEQLSLKDNFLCDLSGLEHMHKLQVLHLDGNYILQVTASSFSLPQNNTERIGLTALGHLNYKDKAKIEPRACWPDLKEFGLSCNRISKIERLELLCPKLQVLDLGSNNLSSLGGLEESGLLGLQCLRVLDVGQNRLNGKSLWDSLIHCPLLVSLVASRNLLQELPTHVGSIFLRELWLNGNIIKCFSCIAWMPNLQRLYLQDNEIDTLMPIWGLPSLEVHVGTW
jgi:Leucine-rich repeat (LRR) protein